MTAGSGSSNMTRTVIKSKFLIMGWLRGYMYIYHICILDCKKLLTMVGVRTSVDYIGEITPEMSSPHSSISRQKLVI